MLNLTLMFLLALLPIAWLIFALLVLKIQTHFASLISCVIAFFEALLIWKLPILQTATAALEGVALAIWPILIVIIAAVFTYNITVHTKAMETIKQMITSVSSDKRILMLLLAWSFGAFLEGIAGFGVAIAIPATMMVAMGFNPVKALQVCLLANGTPTMFGGIGIPTVTLASITGLDASLVGMYQTLQVAPIILISPFLMVAVIGDGFKANKDILAVTLVSALSFLIPELLTVYFIGPEIAILVAAISSLVFTVMIARRHNRKHGVPAEYDVPVHKDQPELSLRQAITAWSPYIIIFFVLLLTSKIVPFINGPLSSIKTSVHIYQGIGAKPFTFTWINTPGVLILISGSIGGLIQGCRFSDFAVIIKQTCIQMYKTMITMTGILACAKIMGYSGMISSISLFLVTLLGSYYPLAAPWIGALGTFVTGSGTSSTVLFGNLQLEAAHTLNVNEYWLCASNLAGVSAGKMLAPQSIAIGCASCDAEDKVGELLTKVFKYSVSFLILLSVIVYVGSLVL